MQWEYKITRSQNVEDMNTEGLAGWELVQIHQSCSYYKRPAAPSVEIRGELAPAAPVVGTLEGGES